MGFVRTFSGFFPPARVDAVPFNQVAIQESASSTGPWTGIDLQNLIPVDADPAHPQQRNLTTVLAAVDPIAWYRLVWKDAGGGQFASGPIPFNASDSTGSFATIDDVARVLQVLSTDLDPLATAKALEVASEWVKIYLRDQNLGTGNNVVESHFDVREDSDLPAWGTVTSISVLFAAGSTPQVLDAGSWTSDGERVRLRPDLTVVFDGSGSGDEAITRRLPATYTRVDVALTKAQGVSPIVTQAAATAAASLLTRSARTSKGLTGERIGDYSYTVASLQDGDPYFEEAKSLLRPLRGITRESLVP